jgi:hypothetical protein
MFYSFKLLFYNIINFKKILLKKHVWSFCMGSLGPMWWTARDDSALLLADV